MIIMDDYKYRVIEKVREMPLLWDPKHVDYKNKDNRQQAWDMLESNIQAPGKGVTVKQTWEGLNRAFNSAMNRQKNKKFGISQGEGKPWKFETSMNFLKVIKEKRKTTSNFEESDDSEGDENSRIQGVLELVLDESSINEVSDDEKDNSLQSKSFNPIPPKPLSKSTGSKRKSSTDDVYDEVRAQPMEEKQKSHRLKFFESIMPMVDEMREDYFLDFQIEVLSSLKRFRENNPSF